MAFSMTREQRCPVLNIDIDCLELEEIQQRFNGCSMVFTPNMDHLWNLQSNKRFLELYRDASMVICDSKIIALIVRLLGGPKIPVHPGSELFPTLCNLNAGNPNFRVFLLGGTTPRHAELARDKLLARGVVVCGCYSPPIGFDSDPRELARIVSMIGDSGASVVAVGVGSPKQELFIGKLRHKVIVDVTYIGVGATIDFISGLVQRAPRIWRTLHLEWLFRLLMEPRRLFRRYLVHDSRVVWLLFKQKFSLYRDPLN